MAKKGEHDKLDFNKLINDPPDKWNPKWKEKKIRIVGDRRLASSVSTRIFEDVSRELISVTFDVKHSKHSVDMEIAIRIGETIGAAVAGSAMTLLFEDIKRRVRRYWRMRSRRNRDRDDYY